MKKHLTIIHWCEIEGTADATHVEADLFGDEEGTEYTLPIDTDEPGIIAFLREANDDEPDDDDGNYYWRVASFGRTENTATVEFRSGRGHLAITTIVWFA